MTAEKLIFVVDNFYFITGKGTVLTGKLLNKISVGENIILVEGGNVYTRKILRIESSIAGEMEESTNARSGELVGIWIDFPKEKIKKGMGLFLEKERGLESSEDVNRTSFKEMMAFLDTTSQNSVQNKAKNLNAHLEKYLVPLKAKEEDLVYLDDYGDRCYDLWWEECHKFIDRKLLILKMEIIEECRLLLMQNFDQDISKETMEIFDEYLNTIVDIRITNQIDALLADFEN